MCLDGNNSLKRMKPVHNREAVDKRILADMKYFIPRTEVDRFAHEVKGRRKKGPEVRSRDDAMDAADVDETDDAGNDSGIEDDIQGDPTDGLSAHAGDAVSVDVMERQQAIAACTKNWKAAQADEVKRMWDIFDESGVFASACRHGITLALTDMVESGEL